ncbi:uncharacterized protein LOC115885660 isoform X9 [Sitophilus oryzae]|uniref:Uncharacterized protein LOC115885660 isoform X9 n=1 Tax=Sitophilus oryzae TaxID=7048 RepID=A0A6J2YBC2_SITOR|nr:uncharacterized protein LOC115885660 isoform X9 [Sitophilus oryzae]XP_030760557.1 uncharacterized protein LOC115885660 isoform X9 [Sitophilus oryzae]
MGYKCVYLYCSTKTGGGKSLFRFPEDKLRAKAWLKAAGREDLQEKNLKNYKLCEDHFETKFISVSSSGFKRLYDTAVPTKFLKPSSSRNEDIFEEPPEKITVLSDIPLDVLQRPFGVTPDKEYVTNISEEMVTSELSIDTGSTCLAASPLISPMSTQTPSTLTSNTPRKSKLKSDPIADAPELVNVAEIKAEIDDPDLVDPAQFTDDPSVHIKVEVPDELYEPKHIPDIDTEESKIDPSCLNEVLSLVPYSETSSSDSDIVLPPIMPEKSKICRKRPQSDKSDWLAVKNKIRREKGQSYLGRIKLTDNNKWSYEKPKEPRKMKERCTCQKKEKGVMKCATISENDRKKLFDHFWAQLTWDEKRVYINNTVILVPTQRHRHRKIENQSRRSQSLSYHLRVEDDNVRKTDTALPKKRPASEQLSEENCLSKKLKTTIKKEDSTIEDSTIEDEAYVLAQSWARKYRELRPGQQLLAKKAIEDILSTAKCDALLENSVIINGGLSLPCAGTSTNL